MTLSLEAAKKTLSRESAIPFLILLIAAFFRFYRLNEIPPGLHFDESYHAFDVLRLLQGQFAIFFPANNGREPLYLYLLTVGVALFGPQAIALRLTSAIIGTATVPVVYGFTRALFHSTRVAAFAALFTAISVWHIYASRFGERMILAVLFVLLTLWFFWRGISPSLTLRARDAHQRGGEPQLISHFNLPRADARGACAYALAGMFAALSVYSYTNARLLPIILVTLTAFAILLHRAGAKQYLIGFALAGGVALILFLPLGFYFLQNPDQFLTHTSNLSILDPRVNKGDLVGTLWGNLFAVAGMFLVRGDHEIFRNVANRPVFDPLIGLLFVIGLVLLLGALLSPRSSDEARLRAVLIATAIVVFLSTSVFSDDAPVFTRTIPALPFVMILPAWGASAIWDRLSQAASQKIIAAGFGIIVLVSAAQSFRDYFIDFGASPALYYAFDVDKIDAASWINKNSETSQIYLAPLWFQEGTLSLYTRNAPLKSFESRDTIVLPSRAAGKDALYAFPLEQEQKAAKLAERLGRMAVREDVTGSTGEKILVVYRVPASDLPDLSDPLSALARGSAFLQPRRIERAAWGDQLKLLGYHVDPEGPGGRNLVVTLFLYSLKPMSEDYTFSIKVRDEKDRAWGQEDKWLGDNSYTTTAMSVGDVIVEKFYPGLSACAPAGEYRVSVEMYDPKTGQVAALADGATLVSLGVIHAEASQGNLYPDLEPERSIDADISPEFHLWGFTLTPGEVRAGGEFSLSLFWSGVADGALTRHVSVRLQNATLADRDITLPSDGSFAGRGLCTLFDLRVPPDVSPGAASLLVNNVKITSLEILR